MIFIVAFGLTFAWLCQVSKEKMEKKLHNWNSGLCEMQPAYTVLTKNASQRMFLPNSFL